ncbi:hypothetical protein ACWEQN_39575 [Streptomyces sp. NPDC004129]
MWFPTPYGVQFAGEWPELRGRRPPRTVTDRTAVGLRAAHALTVTKTALAFLQDAHHRGELCRPLDWIPEVNHPIGGGEAVIPDALLYYRRGTEDGDHGAMLRAFVEVAGHHGAGAPVRQARLLRPPPALHVRACRAAAACRL